MPDPGQTAPRPVRISLQAQLLALVLVCDAVPLLSMGGYLLKRNQETLRDKVHEGLANQLFGKSAEVNEWMVAINERLGFRKVAVMPVLKLML